MAGEQERRQEDYCDEDAASAQLDVPEDGIPNLDMAPLVFREAGEVPFYIDVWSEPANPESRGHKSRSSGVQEFRSLESQVESRLLDSRHKPMGGQPASARPVLLHRLLASLLQAAV